MFYRKITEQLRQWKSNPRRAPLIIQGLRQVGKTTVAIAFGNENYDNVFYVDFRKQIDAHCKAKHLVRITSSNIGYVNNILTVPHYMTFLLNELRFESLGDEA